MKGNALAIANNDIVYLWWSLPVKVKDCLGFSIHRLQAGKPATALPAFVAFDGFTTAPGNANTDFWPIQSFQWKDLFVPEETDVSYEIIAMTGTPGDKLTPIPGATLKTNLIRATDKFGTHHVVFNRGIISTQSISKQLPHGASGTPNKNELIKHITTIGDKIRAGLAGEALTALPNLLKRAVAEGGKCYAALYELTDSELLNDLEAAKGHVELILTNADGSKPGVTAAGKPTTVKDYDATNRDSRARLHLSLGADIHDRLLSAGSYIGHNKFVVYVDKHGTPQAVLTGSTNWTATGLCAQSNNALLLESTKIAARYLDFWKRLLADDAKQGPQLRTDNRVAPTDISLGGNQGTLRVWFSPNTTQKTKPANAVAPLDMAEVFQAISDAKLGVLFLLFNSGDPSIASHLKEVETAKKAANLPFYIRGAISDATSSQEFATRVYKDSLLTQPNTVITGIAGVPDAFGVWQKELAQLGYAVIHDKIVVIDPFTSHSTVITGSHNLGYKASFSNDENLCIIRGNRRIAEAYASHVLDITNHYAWRSTLVALVKAGKDPSLAFSSLKKADTWQ
ncbi:MAG: phospholipase D-like domain-containing protein, partial [Gemmatimonadaceae bacterium]